MRPTFCPRLVNHPLDDPGLFIPFAYQNRAIMFDLGDLHQLALKEMVKISHVFVTHTHMDHFIGFDRLLRVLLGRNRHLWIFGPQGFLANIEGKLAGFSWDLVHNYTNGFTIVATEVRRDLLVTQTYPCADRFIPPGEPTTQPFYETLLKEPALSVSTVLLDHSISCLGLCIAERFHINIKKDRLAALGLEAGPWLNEFKRQIYDAENGNAEFTLNQGSESSATRRFVLGDLAREIALVTPGQKIAYITDVGFSTENAEKMIALARHADHLYIEAAFLHEHKDIAQLKNHLTAKQAGTIAGLARVKQMTPFHFSPRYAGHHHLIEEEARNAYQTALKHNTQTALV